MRNYCLVFCLLFCLLTVGVQAQEEVALSLPEVELGNSNVALPLVTANFTSVVGLQFTLAWNPVELVLDSVGDFQLPGLNATSFNVDSVAGTLRFIWFDPSLAGVTLADGNALFQMYFSAGANPMDTNRVDFLLTPTAPQVVQLEEGDFNEYTPDLSNGFITLRPELSLTFFELSQVSCFGANDGSIAVQLADGLPPYDYFWNSVAGGDRLEDLGPGEYELLAIDSDMDTIIANFAITEPAALNLEFIAMDATCSGAADGSVSLTTTGGTPEYSYLWSSGETTATVTGLIAGTPSVLVTDANGCNMDLDFTIAAPDLILETIVMQPSCATNDDGVISLLTLPLANISYQWDYNNATTAEINSLAAAIYAVTVSHPSGCEEVMEVELTIPDAIDPQLSTIYGCGDGSVQIRSNPPGEIDDYTFNWSTGSTNATLFNLNAGNYNLTFTDTNGCITEEEITVEFRPPFTITSNIIDISCFGAEDGAIQLALTGGSTPYSFEWTDGETTLDRSDLAAGTYEISLSAGADCNVFRSFVVNEPAPLSFNTEITMQGNNLFTVVAQVSGGSPPYNYQWSNGGVGAVLTDLAPGNYELQVTDQNNCQYTAAVMVGTTNTQNLVSVKQLKVWPNPAQSYCYFTDPLPSVFTSAEISIHNFAGQYLSVPIVRTNGEYQLKLQHLPAGIYCLSLMVDDQHFIGKFIVE